MSTVNLDTITAIATPPGRGGVGIVRISGQSAKEIAQKICQKKNLEKDFFYAAFYDENHQLIDHGVILFFQNPHSFTGEDVIELQAHGSPIVLDQLIRAAIHYGARMAEPGEFSKRAFLNKKIDLVQAESIADLIAANSEAAARSAVRSLQGDFSKKITALQNQLTALRIQIEAMIDFPEEEIDFLADPHVLTLLQNTMDAVEKVKNSAKQGALLQNGLRVVIVGKPNAGKSSLLNYLSGRESAIVTDIPGTTRDILRESIQIDGLPLHIVDTAGLRETDDVVEKEGVRRAYAEMTQADIILRLEDATEVSLEAGSTQKACYEANRRDSVGSQGVFYEANGSSAALDREIIIKNKIDLTNDAPGINDGVISISLKKNLGLDILKSEIKKIAGFQSSETDGFIARRRHVDAIERAYTFLQHGQHQLIQNRAGELLAEDLRQAQLALSEITGEFSADDLLGKIFSSFCIGK